MFDFGLGELLLVGVVALIVLGPERLPQAARTAGRLVGKLQGFVNNVKQELNTQAELDELRKVRQEFEAAASEFRDGIKDLGNDAQKNLSDISDGLKPWERLPEQKTPADFGVDELGNPLPDLAANGAKHESAIQASEQGGAVQTQELVEAENAESEQDRAWREYLTASVSPAPVVEVSYVESPVADVPPLHTTSLRKQAMSRKRDMRPKFHAKPKLRVRK